MQNYGQPTKNVILKKGINLFIKLYFHELIYKILHPLEWIKNIIFFYFNFKEKVITEFNETGFYNLSKNKSIQIIARDIANNWNKQLVHFKNLQIKNNLSFDIIDKKIILNDPKIINLVKSKELNDIIMSYLREKIEIANISIWLSRKKELHGSPNFHLDSAGYGNARLYIYLNDVNEGCGEFTYINKKESLKVLKNSGYHAKSFSDIDFFKFTSKYNLNKVIGKAGTVFLIDTTRCFHMGSRCISGDRFVLIVNFQKWCTTNSIINEEFKII